MDGRNQKIILGRDTEGKSVVTSLAEMKSALIGGVSGSGKSTLLRSIISQVANTDAQVVIVDLKRVCFLNYKEKCPVITDRNNIPQLFQQMCDILEGRYIEMEEANTDVCNRPHILLVIDEMADVMPSLDKKCKDQLHQILSLGRQANMTVIAATQTPSKTVLGSIIVDQFQTRIGLRVSNRYASQITIGEGGCENIPNFSAIVITANGRKIEMRLIPPKGSGFEQQNLDKIVIK